MWDNAQIMLRNVAARAETTLRNVIEKKDCGQSQTLQTHIDQATRLRLEVAVRA